MNDATQAWDFFIAHAGSDGDIAEILFEYLAAGSRPFLDSKCLVLGDDWDLELARAQRLAKVTLVLVSSRTPSAYYEREELAAAIALARKKESKHRVVPIYLPGTSSSADEVPYGLRLKHGVSLHAASDLKSVAEKLLALVHSADGNDRGVPTSPVSDDEAELIRHLFGYEGRCKIGAATGEYESLWVPGEVMNMQWGWERTPEYAHEAGKTTGDRVDRLRWIFVVRDLVDRGYLIELPKEKPRQTSSFYELTELGWRTGLALAAQPKKPVH
jgi:TIR domain-containing protein